MKEHNVVVELLIDCYKRNVCVQECRRVGEAMSPNLDGLRWSCICYTAPKTLPLVYYEVGSDVLVW